MISLYAGDSVIACSLSSSSFLGGEMSSSGDVESFFWGVAGASALREDLGKLLVERRLGGAGRLGEESDFLSFLTRRQWKLEAFERTRTLFWLRSASEDGSAVTNWKAFEGGRDGARPALSSGRLVTAFALCISF
jgi:hypothetical protein